MRIHVSMQRSMDILIQTINRTNPDLLKWMENSFKLNNDFVIVRKKEEEKEV